VIRSSLLYNALLEKGQGCVAILGCYRAVAVLCDAALARCGAIATLCDVVLVLCDAVRETYVRYRPR
jgi:hypothetical protein